ncbi:MAG TPA: hypothetical protein VLT83_07650 [Opitutaceae bacterium]|nr:hypothetical protein [Opitutaceae bacterium]
MPVLRVVRHWFRRPAIRMGSVDNSRIRTTRTKNAQFISYLVESGFRQVNVDHYEAGLRRRRWARAALFCLLGAGGAWVVIESARALSMF